ncbi:MAG: UDP-N-acetylmuramoyl-L-alanine--D-glutamate ligase [Aquificota bacterium]|nr:MAG: UDP-N-acetylmuramoyl-L-alanine--D-glutamate ligase [Aquificota bacterium]
MGRFLLWGLGLSGRAAVKLLQEKGYEVYAGDDARGDDFREYLEVVDTIVLSPGVPPSHPLWKEGEKRGIEVIGELELAWRFFKGKALAITGTDGKSTTTRLTYLILREVFANVQEGGNTGKPFSEIVLENPSCLAVLEVSSFQGKTLKTFRPVGGAFLNFAPDHLDWHPDLEDYLRSKQNIFARQEKEDFLLLNGENPFVANTQSRARRFFIGEGKEGYLRDGKAYFLGEEVFSVERLRLKGKHNYLNALFASAIARLMGVEREVVQEVLYNFKGLPYRMEYVGKIRGIEVYNDSKATTPHALGSALESFPDGRVLLIAGGKDKGLDFESVKKTVLKKTRVVILIGEAKEKIAKAWSGANITFAKSLEEAVGLAFELGKEGDYLLFSPGCASFDMFRDYKERGERFNYILSTIA